MDKTKNATADQKYRGATADRKDDNKVSDKRVAADICEMNNNPRNHKPNE